MLSNVCEYVIFYLLPSASRIFRVSRYLLPVFASFRVEHIITLRCTITSMTAQKGGEQPRSPPLDVEAAAILCLFASNFSGMCDSKTYTNARSSGRAVSTGCRYEGTPLPPCALVQMIVTGMANLTYRVGLTSPLSNELASPRSSPRQYLFSAMHTREKS